MIALIQRVSEAAVRIDGQVTGEISHGILALVGVEASDDASKAGDLLHKLLHYRIFGDDQGRMNLNVVQAGGGLLLVPQFTLVADTSKGMRPGFSNGAPPDVAKQQFEHLLALARQQHDPVGAGVFGADMKVSLVNDGPVTFWLQV